MGRKWGGPNIPPPPHNPPITRNRGVGCIEEHQRCIRLGSYFIAVFLAATSYSRGDFILCLAVSVKRVMVPVGIMFHLEPGTIHPCCNLLVPDVFDNRWISRKSHSFLFVIEGGGDV